MFSVEVKEQSALALWSLAGQTKSQQREIAESVGIPMLIEILLRDSDKLQFVGMLIHHMITCTVGLCNVSHKINYLVLKY